MTVFYVNVTLTSLEVRNTTLKTLDEYFDVWCYVKKGHVCLCRNFIMHCAEDVDQITLKLSQSYGMPHSSFSFAERKAHKVS